MLSIKTQAENQSARGFPPSLLPLHPCLPRTLPRQLRPRGWNQAGLQTAPGGQEKGCRIPSEGWGCARTGTFRPHRGLYSEPLFLSGMLGSRRRVTRRDGKCGPAAQTACAGACVAKNGTGTPILSHSVQPGAGPGTMFSLRSGSISCLHVPSLPVSPSTLPAVSGLLAPRGLGTPGMVCFARAHPAQRPCRPRRWPWAPWAGNSAVSEHDVEMGVGVGRVPMNASPTRKAQLEEGQQRALRCGLQSGVALRKRMMSDALSRGLTQCLAHSSCSIKSSNFVFAVSSPHGIGQGLSTLTSLATHPRLHTW